MKTLFIYAIILSAVLYFRFGMGMNFRNMDFQSYYAAGIALEAGLNPYEKDILNSEVVKTSLSDELDNNKALLQHERDMGDHVYPYLYPPQVAVYSVLLSYYLSREVWILLNFLLLIGSLKLIENIFTDYLGKTRAILFSLALGILGPFLYILNVGQADIIYLFAAALFVFSYKKSEKGNGTTKDNNKNNLLWIAASLVMGMVCLLKPHGIFLFFLLPMLQPRYIKYFIIGLIAINILPLMLYPQGFVDYISMILGGPNVAGLPPVSTPLNTSLTSLFSLFVANPYIITQLVVIAFISYALYASHKYGNTQTKYIFLYIIFLTAFLIYTPYLWFQHLSYFIIIFIVTVGLMGEKLNIKIGHFIFLLSASFYWMLTVMNIVENHIKGLHKIMPLVMIATILYYIYLLKKHRQIK